MRAEAEALEKPSTRVGGGGMGNPADRDRRLIEKDLRQGVLSPARAQSVYGYKK